MKRRKLAPVIFTIPGVLTADECQQVIAFAERRGFDQAIINAGGAKRWDLNTWNNDRLIDDDFDLSKRLWSRVEEFMPPVLNDRAIRGFNDRLQYYRYAPGPQFVWHFDGHINGPNGEESFLTFMVYLNEGYEGGETQFESVSVASKLGMALVFEHDLLHQDAEVTGGIKYVLRSDVMYGLNLRNVRPWAWCEAPVSDNVSFVASCWQRCKDHYRSLWCRQPTDYDGGRGKDWLWSMRDLVERVAPLAIAENIYPWNAHSHVRVVLRKGEPVQHKRLVHMWCARHGSHVAIEWYKDGRPVMLTVKAMDNARWQRIVNWLDLAKADPLTTV